MGNDKYGYERFLLTSSLSFFMSLIMGLFGNKEEKLKEEVYQKSSELKNKKQELKRCREEREVHKENIEAIFRSDALPMMVVGEDGFVERVNDSMKEYFEITEKEVVNKPVEKNFEFIHSLLEYVLEKGENVQNKYHSYDIGDEQTKHFMVSSVLLNEQRQSSKALFTFKDMTEQKDIETKFKKLKNRHEVLVEKAPISICIADLEENLLYINEQMADEFGYSKEELEDKNLLELVPEDEREKLRKKAEKRKDEVMETYELKLEKRDGTVFETLLSAAPYKN
ncbi:MAG: PAS domain S-box protein, partial [Candidatus Thermoplasmatota archaeon]|nr:PAS domain S-box protein [Candidatus Thermoplasmatota archaeon]